MNNDKMLMPKVKKKDSSKGKILIFSEKHLLMKVILLSVGLKNFQPNKSKIVGDHASRFRTIHITTGGA